MVLSMDRWRGKTAVITGAGAGIGTAIAAKLVEKGLQVADLSHRALFISRPTTSKSAKTTDGDTEKWRKVLNTDVLGLCIATREAIKVTLANN
ncbi:hypothetical protein BDFB_015113, partial [Asbolus verrucosus]